jgi:hypothetical protein
MGLRVQAGFPAVDSGTNAFEPLDKRKLSIRLPHWP